MSSFLIQPDADGVCCGCDDKPEPCSPCVPGTCDLFIPDSTLYGEQTVVAGVGTLSWVGLGVGYYKFVHVSHAYKSADDFTHCGPNWTIGGLSYSSTDYSGALPANSAHTWVCSYEGEFGPATETTSGYATEAESVADYATKDLKVIFVGQTVVTDTAVLHHSFGGTSLPVFDLMRYRKLEHAQPTALIVAVDTFADGRFKISYDGQTTALLALDANSTAVSVALNALTNIVADGGVVCSGTLAAGMTVTWNNNGARVVLTAAITTKNPGMLWDVVESTHGDAGTPEVQTLSVKRSCSSCNSDVVSDEWTGGLNFVRFGYASWRYTESDPTDYFSLPTETTDLRMNGSQFAEAWVLLLAVPSGNIEVGAHKWLVTFVTDDGESTAGPASATITYGPGPVQVAVTLPIGPAGVNSRRLYRTAAGGSVFKFVNEIEDNVTTSYTDNMADGSLGVSPPGVSVVPPPTAAPVPARCHWKLILFCFITVFGSLAARVIWTGQKMSGTTPEGIYQWTGSEELGLLTCGSLDQSKGVRSLVVTGTDFVS